MAFILKTSITPNQATKEITLADISGVYNSITNPTGYGPAQVPTGTREANNILQAEHYILGLADTFSYVGNATPSISSSIYSVSIDQATAESLATGTTVTTSLANIPAYSDGIYKSLYVNCFAGEDVCSYGPNENQCTWNGDVNLFTNAVFIKIFYESSYLIYEILSVDTVNGTVTVNGLIPQELTDAQYEIGFLSTVYFQNVHDINKCLHTDIAKSACSDCGCNKSTREKLFVATMDFFGIQPNLDRGNYKCAQEIIDSITIYCSKSGCNC